jgi:hypothetical protein
VATRRPQDPGAGDHQYEHAVGGDECPPGRLEKQHFRQPVGDEGFVVGLLSGARAQPLFPDRQRAQTPEPGLHCDHHDQRDVQPAQPLSAHPAPAERAADQQRERHADDEYRDADMDCEHGIGEDGGEGG